MLKASSQTSFNGKSTFELAYIRRVCIREQKLHSILTKLEQDLPVQYIYTHCFTLFLSALIVVAIQIVLIVFKSPLFYICAGFWCGAYYILCATLGIFTVKKRSYKLLYASSICHFIGIFVNIGGIVVVSSMDLALFNTSCFFSCTGGPHVYLCFVMIIIGVLGSLICLMYVIIIEYTIFRESRSFNAYYENA